MKLKHTTARKANTRFDKRGVYSVYNMSVKARRDANIYGPDAADYDRRHGVSIVNSAPAKKRAFLGLLNRRTGAAA